MRYFLRLALMVLVWHCFESASARAYSTFGDGTESCGAYVQAAEREKMNPMRPEYVRDRYYIGFTSFANGFISGANMMGMTVGQSGNIGHGSDVDGRMLWLENWCRQHPVSMFTDAVAQLVVFLKNQRQ